MKRSTFTIALYLLVLFGSGVIVGAVGYRLIAVSAVSAKAPARPTPEEWRRQYLNEMESRLKLTADQNQKLNASLDETRSRFHEARANHDLLVKTIKEEQRGKVRAILSDTQRPDYEKLRAEREQRSNSDARR